MVNDYVGKQVNIMNRPARIIKLCNPQMGYADLSMHNFF